MQRKDVLPEDIAKAMGLDIDQLWSFARHIDVCYKPRRMQWDGKKHRPIDPLYKQPKRLLKRLHGFLQQMRFYHPRSHGGVRRRSCFTSARRHVGQRYVWTRDAADCYPSVSPEKLHHELRALGFRYETARLLTLLFTYRGGIPQGSPVSSDALNLFFWRRDQLIASMAGQHGVRYSRVADDFVLSGKGPGTADEIVARMEAELAILGIAINEKKKRDHGLQTCSVDRRIHSISVSKPRGTSINRDQAAEARAIAANYLAACKSVSADSIQAIACKRQRLTGWLYYCRQADFGPAKMLRQQLDAGDCHVLRKLRSLNINSPKNKWWLVNEKQRRDEPRRIAKIWRSREAALRQQRGGKKAIAVVGAESI